MARAAKKPEMVGVKNQRQLIWEAIRRREGTFVQKELQVDLYKKYRDRKISPVTVRDYLRVLCLGGFLINESPGRQRANIYRLAKDAGVEAPRLNKQGGPCLSGRGIEQVWLTLRRSHWLTCAELAAYSSTADIGNDISKVRKYCRALHKAGYLERNKNDRGEYIYRLTMNTGPKPPVVQNIKQVYDPNTGTVVWAEKPEDALNG